MAKRKMRVIWVHQNCIPETDRVIQANVHGPSSDFEMPNIGARFVRFVEAPAKKARKKK